MSTQSDGVEIYRCECGKPFLTEHSLNKHVGNVHNSERPTSKLTDVDIRELVETCLIRTNSYASKPVLHAHDDDDNPLCESVVRTGKWNKKNLSVIPEGYSEWCKTCALALEDTHV